MKITVGDMGGMRLHLCVFVFVLLLMPWGGWVSAKEWMPPITLSGSLGFNYRTLDGPEGRRTVSRQGLGNLYASSYIYRPWLATTDMALTFALDGSESRGGKSREVETKSSIVSGVLNLNVLPKSRAPFNLRYSVTDTRVDSTALSSDAVIVLAGGDTTTSKLSLTQSYIAEGGHRVRFIYDNNRWESENNGVYEDQTAAVEVDLRGPKQRLTLNGKVNEATRSKTGSNNQSTLFDATHYYYPKNGLRVDTRASTYEMERDFDVPSANLQSGISAFQVNQLSSSIFYRPHNNSPWSLSAGLRAFDMSGENAGGSNDSENFSGTFGGYYQYSRRLRFNFNASYSAADSNAISTKVNRQRIGALFQSDMHAFWKAKYHWFVDASFNNASQNQEGGEQFDAVGQQRNGNEQNYAMTIGHNLSRSWFTEGGAVFRASLAQSLSEGYSTETEDNALREETSITLNWNKHAGGGSTYVQLTGSQGVNFRNADNISERYMGWFQINHEQRISRRSSLSGNLSAQYVFHDFEGSGTDSEITTATAKINYRNRAIFSIPRFSFNSDFRLSRASEERGVDRYEWENRLDHAVGQLTTSLSHRIIGYDSERYAFLFLRILRHF